MFNINTGESATFNDVGATASVENILSRITGGSASNIDGALRTDFGNASPNLFLLNPAGVLFSPHAQLEVQFLLRLPDSLVSASSQLGIDGVVEIDSPETDLNAGLVPLPANFFDAAQVLMRPCAERSGADVIRLVVRPYEVARPSARCPGG